mmetsp:Transcript_39690/g.78183  ORF Transcript_39690/g.78183 Transcript_39690/m.78183 type:complete len:88 (+) Transcript_39690:1132-1395(+)
MIKRGTRQHTQRKGCTRQKQTRSHACIIDERFAAPCTPIGALTVKSKVVLPPSLFKCTLSEAIQWDQSEVFAEPYEQLSFPIFRFIF